MTMTSLPGGARRIVHARIVHTALRIVTVHCQSLTVLAALSACTLPFASESVIASSPDESVLKDHSVSWVNYGGASSNMLMQHRFLGSQASGTLGASVVFETNGGTLATIGIVWAHESIDGTPNGGNTSTWDWKFGFTWSSGWHNVNPWFDNQMLSITHTFEVPTNPDWFVPIGIAGEYLVYYSEVDVSFLNIPLPESGQGHAILIPDCTGVQTATALLSFSDGNGALGWEDDRFTNASCAPDTLSNFNAPHAWGAYRVTATLCGSGDVNCDGVVDVNDMIIVINNLGQCEDCEDCPADVTGDCIVNYDDLLYIFNNWH